MFPLISAIILLVILAITKRFLIIVTVIGYSMFPALEHGDRVLIVRHLSAIWLRHNQLVVVDLSRHNPITTPKSTNVIKRLVGLPGDDISGYLPHTNNSTNYTVPTGHFFVMTDGKGEDSRVWGCIPYKALVGIVIWKLPSKASASELKPSDLFDFD